MEVKNLTTFTDRRGLSEWFERNHLSEKCCWVACNRSKTAKPDTLRSLRKPSFRVERLHAEDTLRRATGPAVVTPKKGQSTGKMLLQKI